MEKIIAVANQKGGVGKTTTSICVGSTLAKLGKRVLIVDLDPQGNSTIALGFDNERISKTVFSVLTDKVAIQKTIKRTVMENLFLVPSNISLSFFSEENLNHVEDKDFILKRQISMICSDFDYIIIDTPPSNGLINRNALTASDSVIIPLQCEYFAMESITAILAMIRNIKTTNNANLGIEGFLFTMFDPNDNFQIQIANEIRGLFGDQVFSDYIPRNNSIPESQAKGIPVIMFRPNSFGAQAYLQVVREIIQKNS
jgi:chromosome partitioning protein